MKKKIIIFVDLDRTYDKMNRFEFWNVLHKNGVESYLWNMIRVIYFGNDMCENK